MRNCFIGWQNTLKTAALRSSSEIGGLGIANLAGDQPSLPWQTAGGVTSAYFDIDAGSAITWALVGLHRRNDSCTAGSTVTYQFGSSAGGGDILSVTAPSNCFPGYQQSIYAPSSAPVSRYLRISLSDPSNPDGFLRVGACFAGPVFQPGANLVFGQADGWQDDSKITRTRGGQEYAALVPRYRTQQFEFDFLTEAEKFATVHEIDRVQGVAGNVLFVPDPDSTWINRHALYGRITASAPVSVPKFNRFSKSYKMTERL